MDAYTIRRAGEGDADALALVGAASFLSAFLDIIPGEHLIAHCQTQHSAEKYAAWLAAPDPQVACWLCEHEETGAPAGYAVTCAPDLPIAPQPGDLELKRIYLLTRAHGSGAASGLMDAALTHAKTLGTPRVLLGVYNGNARAIAFYQRNGFEIVGTRRFQVGGAMFDDLVMSRTL